MTGEEARKYYMLLLDIKSMAYLGLTGKSILPPNMILNCIFEQITEAGIK